MKIVLNLIGIILILILFYLLINPFYAFRFLNSEYYTYDIASNLTSNIITFDFEKRLITKYFENNDSINYIDVYISEFKNNESELELYYITVNDDIYIPANKSYRNSLMLLENTLKNNNTIIFYKDDNLTIDKISLSYYGIDYEYYNMFNSGIRYLILILIIMSALLIIL